MNDMCAICGNASCFESVDHSKITLENLYNILKQNKIINPNISQISAAIHNLYRSLITRLKKQCKEDQRRVQKVLSKYEYSHLLDKRISTEVLSSIAGKYISAFPDKRIIPLLERIDAIAQSKSYPLQKEFQNTQYHQIISNYINNFKIDSLVNPLKEILLGPIIQKQQGKLSQHKIIIRKDNKQEIFGRDSLNFRISNVDFDSRTKQILLSNRRISDKELIENIEQLKKLKVTTLELRNNFITELSCKIIAFNMNYLSKIDIRGNKVKDTGVIILAKHNLCLKELFVSETDISDISAEVISEKLSLLELIWAENNKLTFAGAEMLIEHPKLKVINLEGNIINNEEAGELKARFNKGYISI